jgi:hypothetical protein
MRERAIVDALHFAAVKGVGSLKGFTPARFKPCHRAVLQPV